MTSPRPLRALGKALVAAAFALPTLAISGRAEAFCRTWSCDPATEAKAGRTCPADPANPKCAGGSPELHKPLFWPQKCIGFSLNTTFIPKELGTDAAKFQALFARLTNQAFAAWQKVDCGGGQRPSIAFSNMGFVDCDKHEFNRGTADDPTRSVAQGNANIILFRNPWPYGNNGHTLALTTLTFNVTSGEIYDADMEINATKGDLTTSDTDPKSDLLSILTHEAGHFLGIAHSLDPEATMYAEYKATSTTMRTLEADDKAAVCAVYPPTRTGLPECDPTPRHGYSGQCAADIPVSDSCTVSLPGRPDTRSLWFSLALGAAALAARQRIRRGR